MAAYEEDRIMRTARSDVHLRFYKASTARSVFVVQQIFNLGIHDKRKKAISRERRIVLIKTADRAAAVAAFNKKINELSD